MVSKQKTVDPEINEEGVPIITKKYLVDLCDSLDLYSTPSLNEILYIHHKGFRKIENLQDYTGLKVLYLDHNAIKKIANLGMLKKLRCLYLQNNLIEKIEGLEELKDLTTLNLSHNQIEKIENLQDLPRLENLNLAYNRLESSDAIKGLAECQSLTTVDLSNNNTKYSDEILPIFEGLKNLACLYLKDNPVKREFSNYRKVMVGSLHNLKYLDERPVSDEERRLSIAFKEGGLGAERAEREKMENERKEREQLEKLENKEKNEKIRRRHQLELERIERESRLEREQLLKEREEVLAKKLTNWELRLRYIDFNLEKVNKLLDAGTPAETKIKADHESGGLVSIEDIETAHTEKREVGTGSAKKQQQQDEESEQNALDELE